MARGFGAKQRTAAQVEVHDVAPVEVTPTDVFIAKHEGQKVRTVDRDESEDGTPVVTTHTRPGTIIMYKPTEHHGYVPRTVAVSSIRLLLGQGWAENCPDCRKKHIDKNGVESTDPNLCSARDPVAFIICPVCRQRIYDNMNFSEPLQGEDEDDPNLIRLGDAQESTPEKRLTAARNLHMWLTHPRTSQEMGLPPLPPAMRDMVPEARTG